MSRFAAIVLAAGLSTRFGSPKQLANYQGKPLLLWAVDRALESGASQVIVVVNSLLDRTQINLPPSVQVVENGQPQEGVGHSLSLGVGAIAPGMETCVILLGDQPAVSVDHLLRLVDLVGHSHTLSASVYEDGAIGVPAAFSKAHFARLTTLTGDRGARLLLNELKPECGLVPLDAPAQRDIDYPRDLEEG